MSTPIRLHAILVARNEADRYLDAVLAQLPTDSIHLYDDDSNDDTVAIARHRGALVTRKRTGVPSFTENEGAFRQMAWNAFEDQLCPEAGDWVLSVDCDEFLTATDIPTALDDAIAGADATWTQAVNLRIPEVFELRADGPYVRIDGYWNTLSAPRLFRYRAGGKFTRKAMGCGSEPEYVRQGHAVDSGGLALVHYGYATSADRRTKYDRYMAVGDHGHNPAHITSILSTPVVEPLRSPAPPVWRGRAPE